MYSLSYRYYYHYYAGNTDKTRRRSGSAYIRQVHDNVMMYTSTRLYTRLPSNCTTSSIMTACCGVTGGNGVNIFVHCFSTPISILNLTISPESLGNDVSNDILSEWKSYQIFSLNRMFVYRLQIPY